MPALYACWQEFMKTPRVQGHRGIVVMHLAFDRGTYQTLTELIRRRLIQLAPGHGKGERGVSFLELNWKEWVVCTPCALHDLQNSLKWSLKVRVSDPDLTRRLYITCASLKNSYGDFINILGTWVAKRLVTKPLHQLPDTEDTKHIFLAMSIDASIVDLLSEVLHIHRCCTSIGMAPPS
eukprot:10184338-Lingulodinium_polyedra.AAC.1